MKEENIEFQVSKNVFYNAHMQFCRSFFSLAIGAIGKNLQVLEGLSSSGIRGIRYAKENKNVKKIDFLEANDYAIPIIKKNLKKNKLKAKIIHKLYEKYLANDFFFYDFVEIDPFGTPVPFLWSTFYGQQKKKEFYLSITATDTAVLCGPEAKACMKNYHSKSLNNEFTHETGTRILIKRIAEAAAEFNFGIVSILALSDRHYIKILVKAEKGAGKADKTIAQLGYISYCPKCGWRNAAKRIINTCKNCNALADYAGLLWLGELHDKSIVKKMLALNKKREYEHKEKIGKILEAMHLEVSMPPFYYNTSKLAKRFKAKSVPKIEDLLKKLKKKGHKATRTSFHPQAIKTTAGIKELKKLL